MIRYASAFLKRDSFRFVMSGGINTALTYTIYLLLLNYFSYTISYSIAYASGIILAYILNRFFVFKSHQGYRSALLLPFIYLIQYCLSIIILWAWVEHLDLDARLAPLMTILITTPVTFFLSKAAFVKRKT